uniref:Uncharacterized protein n=1 Tax=Oryza punctata TaxID=4537 RepID=A0A0E0MLE2_ORYPU
MDEDPDLALFPVQGTSPLYLPISLQNGIIAEILHQQSNGNISYSGPHGQNTLHDHQLFLLVMTEQVLKWNNKEGDKNGSTPVHFAASLLQPKYQTSENNLITVGDAHTGVDPFYQSDKNGMFPIHVAASVGVQFTVAFLLNKFPESAGLRDANGRTFLHVAVEKKKFCVVRFACRTPS